MDRIIGVTELQRNFKAVIDEVAERGVPYVLTRGSRPEAALVPYDEYVKLRALEEKETVVEFDRLLERMRRHNADVSEEKVTGDVGRAVAEARGG